VTHGDLEADGGLKNPEQAGAFKKKKLLKDAGEDADEVPTTEWNNGRPRWMESPGVGGMPPVYRSQKPGKDGNQDDLFSSNVNDDPPEMDPIDPDSYYIW